MTPHRSIIYIHLLDEGTTVWLPTEGEIVDEMIFKVLPTENYDPENEHWEFPPGTIVRCEKLVLHDIQAKEVLVAVYNV